MTTALLITLEFTKGTELLTLTLSPWKPGWHSHWPVMWWHDAPL